jgi:hypothetical protein
MDISRSTDEDRKYIAGVSVFSGRPDPTWSISEEAGSKLLKLYDDLASYEGRPVSAPPLGYRGAFLRDDAGHEWFAYRGVVTLTSPHNSEVRTDPNRDFERELVASAPQELIPPALLKDEFDRSNY